MQFTTCGVYQLEFGRVVHIPSYGVLSLFVSFRLNGLPIKEFGQRHLVIFVQLWASGLWTMVLRWLLVDL